MLARIDVHLKDGTAAVLAELRLSAETRAAMEEPRAIMTACHARFSDGHELFDALSNQTRQQQEGCLIKGFETSGDLQEPRGGSRFVV